MEIRIDDLAKVTVVSIVGRLDTVSSAELEQRLTDLFNQQKLNLVLDCSVMEYVSSSGLRVFLRWLKTIQAAKGRLLVAGLQPVVRQVFELSGFCSIFTIIDSVPQAVKLAQR